MQAGFALVETGFCRAKHAAHVVSTNFAIFGLGFVGFFTVGFSFMFGGYSYALPGYDYGYDHALSGGGALIGSGNWVFLWKGGWFGTFFDGGQPRLQRGHLRLLPLHGGLHGHHGHHPDRVDGRAVEVEVVRDLGPVLRRDLLPAVRRLDLGRRLAGQARQLDELGQRLRRLRRLGCGARHGRHRRPRRAPSCSDPASASSTRTASPGPCPAITSRWPCWVRSSCCSAGSASTPPRPSRRAIRSSVSWRSTPRIAAAFGGHRRDALDLVPHRQAGPGDDGQRHARRPGHHHGARAPSSTRGSPRCSASSPGSS